MNSTQTPQLINPPTDIGRIIETPAIDQLFPLDVENKKEKEEVDWMKEGF